MFIRCVKDQLTNITENGLSQTARFYFPAFRFTEQQNQTISSYYLHCITRLCESSFCATFKVSINLAPTIYAQIHMHKYWSTYLIKKNKLAKTCFGIIINMTIYQLNINENTKKCEYMQYFLIPSNQS